MGMHNNLTFYFCIAIYITVISGGYFSLDKSWICDIKKTCVDCLRLSQCSWCNMTKKCFSEELPYYKNYCQEDHVRHVDFGMSLEENAICACDPKHLADDEDNCLHSDVSSAECSGRGKCICGRCFCDSNQDPENPTKTIMGEFCEYDNFSCNDTKCNEGPYNIYELQTYEENLKHNAE